MVQFTVNRALKIKHATSNGYYKIPFPDLVDLYNSVFNLNQHPKCAPCSRNRLEQTLQSWYKLCVQWLSKRGVDIDDPATYPEDLDAEVNNSNPSPLMSSDSCPFTFEIPLGLAYRSMSESQRSAYRLWSESKKQAYKNAKPSVPTKVSEDSQPIIISEHEQSL